MSVENKPTVGRRWRYFTRRHAILATIIVGIAALVLILLVFSFLLLLTIHFVNNRLFKSPL